MKNKLLRFTIIFLSSLLLISLILYSISSSTVVEATGLVDDTVKSGNLYSKYSLNNYQLDFFVDSSWSWLPWNWGDGLGKSVMYGLYAITNFIWTVSLYLSSATGYVVQEAYKLDFISDTAESIGRNIQTLAGITPRGIQPTGFYFGFLLLIILTVGIYVTYTGLLKRETTKAIRALINFVVIFLLSSSFIAYAPTYINKINDFSSDVSEAALSLGTKIVVPNSETKGKNSVDLIRDSLFSIQVQQPWLLLQFDHSTIEEVGEERVNKILSVSPDENKGKDREEAVKAEIENNDNTNLSISKTMNRLGTVVFLVLFNIGISMFVFLLTGIMLFSQILFIIFAMFLPVSFLLSMLPTYESLGKKAIIQLFNTIMMRAGITLIITTAFSISTMFFNISTDYPFFMVAFLQIVTFAGIYFKLGDIMGMFNLQSNDSQAFGSRVMRKPQTLMNQKIRKLNRSVKRTLTFGGGALVGNTVANHQQPKSNSKKSAVQSRKNLPKEKKLDQYVLGKKQNIAQEKTSKNKNSSRVHLAGRKVGQALDTKDLVKDKVKHNKYKLTNASTNLNYAFQKKMEETKKVPKEFKRGLVQEKEERTNSRNNQYKQYQKDMNRKRQYLANQRKYFSDKRNNIPLKNPKITEQKPLSNEIKSPKISKKMDNLQIRQRLMDSQELKQQSILTKQGNQNYKRHYSTQKSEELR